MISGMKKKVLKYKVLNQEMLICVTKIMHWVVWDVTQRKVRCLPYNLDHPWQVNPAL